MNEHCEDGKHQYETHSCHFIRMRGQMISSDMLCCATAQLLYGFACHRAARIAQRTKPQLSLVELPPVAECSADWQESVVSVHSERLHVRGDSSASLIPPTFIHLRTAVAVFSTPSTAAVSINPSLH